MAKKEKDAQEIIDEVTTELKEKQQPNEQLFNLVRQRMDKETLELLNIQLKEQEV